VRKLVENQEGVGRGQESLEEVGKAVGEGGRSGRTWESNGTLQTHYSQTVHTCPSSRPPVSTLKCSFSHLKIVHTLAVQSDFDWIDKT